MIDDFCPIIHHLDGRTIRCYAVADVHLGAKECDLKGFRAFLRRVSEDSDAYLLLCGDMVSNGVKDSLTNVYEEVMTPSMQIDKAVELLTPVKDKILGAVGGNHEARSRRAVDLDPMYAIMLMMGKGELYRTNFAALRIILENGKTKSRHSILLIHGKTANKKRNFTLATEGFGAVVSGHTHNGLLEKPAHLVFSSSNTLSVKPIISLTATSWLDWGGYAAAGLLVPAATSCPQCLELEYTGTNSRDADMRVIW